MPLSASQLDAFHAVSDTGSFSRAAIRLGVTQPALSQRVQELEKQLKKRLFGRAVVPRHLLTGAANAGLRVVTGTKPMKAAVVLHHFRQPAYTRAHEAVRDALMDGVPRALGASLI